MQEAAVEELRCVNHPNVETVVRCSRCEQPICPRCMISTPVGMRCRQCANLHRLPIYELRGRYLWQASGAALGLVLVGSLAFNVLLGALGRSLIVAAALYLIGGWAIASLLSVAANRKRGPVLQALAIGTTILVTQSSLVLGIVLYHRPSTSLFALFLTAAACVLAWQRLR
ncbi:MAG: B-box zinc finger protein [Chloroflexi bacterium]|nr:B-box zinc finger protein [Chloroflexota bacterium]